MGSPDATKIALGFLASTSALILSYVLLKRYGFRASQTKSDEREYEEISRTCKTEPDLPPKHYEGEKDEALSSEAGQLDKAPKLTSCDVPDNEGGDDGQNQTSFIVLGGADSAVPPEGDKAQRKSDKSSDESSYDVIEDDRMADTVDEEEDEKRSVVDDNASAKMPTADRPGGDRPDLESSLETSMVLVDAEQQSVEKSGESFYASADENFGVTHLEEGSEPSSQEAGEDQGVVELSEDETTVMYKSVSGGNDSLTIEGRHSDDTPDAEKSTAAREARPEGDLSPSHVDDPEEQKNLQGFNITDAVLRADLEAASATPQGASQEEEEAELDMAEVTEVLSKCQSTPMNVTKEDIHLLVKLLRKNVPQLHATVLNSIVRIAAFNQNTTNLRESGCPEEIVYQLKTVCEAVKAGEAGAETALTPVSQVLTNLSMDPKAHPKLKESIPSLINLLFLDSPPKSLTLITLRPLVNLSGEALYHAHYVRAVPVLLALLDDGSHMAKVQSLKVLVNLSLNPVMVPHLLAAKAPNSLMALLAAPAHNDVILRTVTMLANIFTAMKETNISTAELPSSETVGLSVSMYTALNDADSVSVLRSKVSRLTSHDEEDVCLQASKLFKFLPETSG